MTALRVRTVPLARDLGPGRPPVGWGVLCSLCNGPVRDSVRPTRAEALAVSRAHAEAHITTLSTPEEIRR